MSKLLILFFPLLLMGQSVMEVPITETSEEEIKKEWVDIDETNWEEIEKILPIPDKVSFQCDLKIKLIRKYPKKEEFNADGILTYSHKSQNLRIKLLDSVIGFVVSDIIIKNNIVSIKDANAKKITQQEIGFLPITDPSTGHTFPFPLGAMYSYITQDYTSEFLKKESYYREEYSEVLVKESSENTSYFFQDRELIKMEIRQKNEPYNSRSYLSSGQDKHAYPPSKISTSVLDRKLNKEVYVIDVNIRSVKKKEISETSFKF
jgi:hypothetical protein